MHYIIALGCHRVLRLRSLRAFALGIALVGCDATKPLDPESAVVPDAAVPDEAVLDETVPEDPVLDAASDEVAIAPVEELDATAAATRQRRGIVFGMTAQPVSAIGDVYSGGKMTVTPEQMLKTLSAVRARGGRVVVMLAGHPRYYKDGGRFSFNKWKARVDRFRRVNFDSYINDGTIIGHYLIDEPQDRSNWRGTTVSPSTVDAMAKYSKQRWPRMATIVRTHPSFFRSKPRYVDAAWAQYLARRGSAQSYIRQAVSDAQRRDLALVVGLNVVHGGTPNLTRMTPREVEAFGSALLSSSYPCAFVSWKHGSHLAGSSMKSAMKTLRRKAESRAQKSCRS